MPANIRLADLPELLPQAQAAQGWVRFGVPSLPGLAAKADLLMRCEVSQVREWKVSVEVSRMSDGSTAEDRLLQKRQAVPMQGLRLDGREVSLRDL
jgi:hypothetical protein